MRFSNLIMKLSESRCECTLFLIVAGCLYLAEIAVGANEFRRCYNTALEMHCFAVQYDTNNGPLITSNDNARQRCNYLNSTLIMIKDEEINNNVKNYMSDPSNPIRDHYVWTDAYRISDYNNSYTWHWLNSKLSNLARSEVSWIWDYRCYATTLEFRSDGGKSQFYLTAKQPDFPFSYVCEYAVSNCSSSGSNVLQFPDRCYISFSAPVTWFEARNRCLKDGGDLASFANVSSINFTSWLGSDPNVRYWIGLRFTWYIWKDSGYDVKFAKWKQDNDWNALCLVTCSNCGDSLSWLPRPCNTIGQIYHVVCHSVTPLKATELTTASATTLPVTTSSSITTRTGNTQSNNTAGSEKSTWSPPIALAVGVGVGVGVPVIVAIIVIVICIVRRHQSRTTESSTTRHGHREEAFPTEVQTGRSDVSEINHYATVRSLSPPSAVEKETSSDTQYATLGFQEAADLKNGNGQSPLNVL